jgi:hypothetical protein
MPMIATTIISSISVKPCWTRFIEVAPEERGGEDLRLLICRARASGLATLRPWNLHD